MLFYLLNPQLKKKHFCLVKYIFGCSKVNIRFDMPLALPKNLIS